MTWVAWRQHRLSLLVVFALVLVTAAVMLWFRIAALDHLAAAGIEGCVRVEGERCPQGAMASFADAFEGYARNFPMVLLGLPALLGMFTGAPLFARDFEQGTHILGLTQSISRLRWWSVKVAVVGLPTVASMFALGLFSAWAFDPLYYVTRGSLLTPAFETQGPVLGAYTALAFAIGTTAGLLLRNTVGAMALTLVLYLVLMVGVSVAARSHYAEPSHVTATVEQEASPVPDDAWRLGSVYYDEQGAVVPFNPSACRDGDTSATCLTRQGVTEQRTAFHPADRFWLFQGIESTIHLAVGAALLGVGLWRVRRIA